MLFLVKRRSAGSLVKDKYRWQSILSRLKGSMAISDDRRSKSYIWAASRPSSPLFYWMTLRCAWRDREARVTCGRLWPAADSRPRSRWGPRVKPFTPEPSGPSGRDPLATVTSAPKDTRRVLIEHRDRQGAERADAGELWTEHNLVFPTSVGTPMEPRSLNRHFDGIRTRAGYPHVRLHDFRHTVVSQFKVSGVASAASFGKIREPLLPATSPFGLDQGRLVEASSHAS
ncbi:MAG: hypothetical protein ACREXR_11475 [Gammaproteobacteria bacterium]